MAASTSKRQTYLADAGAFLSAYMAAIFIGYCVVCLWACPSPSLAIATSGEVMLLVISIALWRANVFTLPSWVTRKVPERLASAVRRATTFVNTIKLLVLALIAVVATVDFSALTLSAAGFNSAGTELYARVPVSYWVGLHPAFSAEMLTGALVQKGDFGHAEPLYNELREIRLRVGGPTSDLMSAMYADLGDFSVRKGELRAAEEWYQKSVDLGTKTGRAMTGLATILREEGKYEESAKNYCKALEVRRNVYGEQSRQYQDTLRGYRRLLEVAGNSR